MEKHNKFWAWTIFPITVGAMMISFGLKPCRNDVPYKTFLYLQYLLLCFGFFVDPELGFRVPKWVCSIIVIVSQLIMFLFAEKVRFLIARQPDTELSDFLTNVVLKGGVFIGLAQLAFLIFSAIQVRSKMITFVIAFAPTHF